MSTRSARASAANHTATRADDWSFSQSLRRSLRSPRSLKSFAGAQELGPIHCTVFSTSLGQWQMIRWRGFTNLASCRTRCHPRLLSRLRRRVHRVSCKCLLLQFCLLLADFCVAEQRRLTEIRNARRRKRSTTMRLRYSTFVQRGRDNEAAATMLCTLIYVA